MGPNTENTMPTKTISAEPDIEPDVELQPKPTENALAPFSNDNALKMWLNNIGLIEYYDTFVENGFSEGTEVLSDLNNEDLKDMGIKKVAHRKKILKQIARNKEQMISLNKNNKMNEFEGHNIVTND